VAEAAGLTFAARVALEGLALEAAFEIRPGERVALVGPSGAGKTTCLHLVAGLRSAEHALITLDGRPLTDTQRGIDVPPHRRDVGLVFQDLALFPHLDALANVSYGLGARGRPRGQVREAAARWLEEVGLADLGPRPVTALSGGERQRVALARAMAAGPRVLLLDEPFSGLDVVTRNEVRAGLRAFLATLTIPALLVTHDALEALMFGDRLVVLEQGRVTQSGSWSELASRPRSSYVAALTGFNLLRATLAPGAGWRTARAGPLELTVQSDEPAGEVWLAFAPTAVLLVPQRFGVSTRNWFLCRMRESLPLGGHVRVMLDGGTPLVADVSQEAADALGLEPGSTIWAWIEATAIRVYR